MKFTAWSTVGTIHDILRLSKPLQAASTLPVPADPHLTPAQTADAIAALRRESEAQEAYLDLEADLARSRESVASYTAAQATWKRDVQEHLAASDAYEAGVQANFTARQANSREARKALQEGREYTPAVVPDMPERPRTQHMTPPPIPQDNRRALDSEFPVPSSGGPILPQGIPNGETQGVGTYAEAARASSDAQRQKMRTVAAANSKNFPQRPRRTGTQQDDWRKAREEQLITPLLVLNMNRQKYSETKAHLRAHLNTGTDILHLRAVSGNSVEIMVLVNQAASVRTQLREMGYLLKNEYDPADMMVRRGQTTRSVQEDRNAFCAHRGMMRDAEQPGCNAVVKRWYRAAADRIEVNHPRVFTLAAQKYWNGVLDADATARAAKDVESSKRALAATAPVTASRPKKSLATDETPPARKEVTATDDVVRATDGPQVEPTGAPAKPANNQGPAEPAPPKDTPAVPANTHAAQSGARRDPEVPTAK